jgi:ankyrin repeat protein
VYRYLIETHGADINVQDKDKNTPLHNALRYFNPNDGEITVLIYLLSQKGVKAHMKGLYDWTLLHTACQHINALPLDVFKVLIETIGCDINAQDKHNNTPVHHALRLFSPNEGADISVLTYLLNQKDINVNIKSSIGHTLLHAACCYTSKFPLDVFKCLIETHCADINGRDKANNTPLHDALRYHDPNDGGDITVLMYLITQKGVDGNIKNQYGYSLLHMACTHINTLPLEIFRYLIETKGCDVNARNTDNDTPLHYAINSFNPTGTGVGTSVLIYLLGQENVDANIKGWDGGTILHKACQKINYLPLDIFKVLIETHGADVNVQDKYNNTSVYLAFREFKPRNGDITVLTYLLNQKGINVNIKNSNGYTLLHLACICDIQDLNDYMGPNDYFMDSEDDFADSEGNLDNHREAKGDTIMCQIVEVIAERCVQQVLDETTL